MGFKRSRVEFEQPDLREPDAPDPDATADYSLNYEQELADFEALPEQEPEEPENPKSPHPRTSTRPTSSRTSSEFRQSAHAKPSS